MSNKVVYLSAYLQAKKEKTESLDPVQLAMFPDPKVEGNFYYYVLNVQNESEASLIDFLVTAKPKLLCELRETPTFFTQYLNRQKFFFCFENQKIPYVYPEVLPSPIPEGVCFLIDDMDVDIRVALDKSSEGEERLRK